MSIECPVCTNPIDPKASVCPRCGFKLLGSTQQFDPVKVPKDIGDTPQHPLATAVLKVVRGPLTGAVIPLSDKQLSIGRSPQCDIFLNDMTVSREHAHVDSFEGGYRIYDARSFNGVWINNESVESRVLKDGDIIQIGAFCLLYKEE